MSAPTLPKPMTPERARKLAKRWGWIAVALLVPASVSLVLPPPLDVLGMPLAVAAILCLLERRGCQEWADGFEVAEKRAAGQESSS